MIGLAARLAPYGLWLKLGALVVALLVGGWLGYRVAEAGNAAETRRLERQISDRDALLARKDEGLRNAARAFREIAARARVLAEQAKSANAANAAAAERAEREYAAMVDRLSGLDAALEAAKRRGGARCKAQMEEPLCIPLE